MNNSDIRVKGLPETMKVENQDSQPPDVNETRLHGTCSGMIHRGIEAVNIFLYKYSVYNRVRALT
jgi:hypothetical protein